MIENEGIRAEDARSCLLCGGEGSLLHDGLRDRLFDAPGVWSLMQCPKCKLVWLNPQPIPEDITKLYAQYFTHYKLKEEKRPLNGLRKSVTASVLKSNLGYNVDSPNRILVSMLSRIGPLREIAESNVMWLKASENGRLLDIGCGNGSFLTKMRQLGWSVVGVEPDEKAVSIAREKLGLEIFQGSLEEAEFPEGYFDAITMNHVIEHVLDPIGLLKECHRVLRPGGELIVVTPNIRSLGQHIFRENWRGYEVPRHLFLFVPEALRICAERSGLVVKELKTSASLARWMWITSRLIKRDDKLPGGSPEMQDLLLRLEGLTFQAIEYGLGGRRVTGEELALIATKKVL